MLSNSRFLVTATKRTEHKVSNKSLRTIGTDVCNMPFVKLTYTMCRFFHSGSQFFLCTKETAWLNGKHVVFGKVVEGMDVVKSIEAVGHESGKPRAVVKIADCGQLGN